MLFRQGHTYIGGVEVPFFVSDDMIRDGLAEKGFTNVQIIDRDVFPISQLPSGAQQDEDWDTVVTGVRGAPDANIDVPGEVRWVVDTTPPEVVVAGPTPGITPIPSPGPGAGPIIPEPPTFSVPGIPQVSISPESVPDLKLPLLVGMGVIGGVAIGWWAVQHMFVEGITSKEKRNFLVAGASMLALWGINELIGLDKAWWATAEGIYGRAQEELEKK